MIFVAMLALGFLIGLVGAGGAGITITMLTVGFGVPIHTALGVSLASMSFTMLSGTISHFLAGDVILKIGFVTGIFGMLGSGLGTYTSTYIPEKLLSSATGIMLLLSTVLLYLQLFKPEQLFGVVKVNVAEGEVSKFRFFLGAAGVGLFNGFLSGAFGIGAAAFIQISLMLLFRISLYHAIGTTMMIILPVSIAGGIGHLLSGHLDLNIFVQTLAGLVIGAFVGAKFTRLIPKNVLKYIIVSIPSIGGLLLLVN